MPKGPKPHLLVIDDDEGVRAVLDQMFIDAEYRVSLASEAVQARRILDTDIPDVCLIDARLLGEPGLSIGQYAESLGVPVLMMTGDAGLSDKMDDTSRANIRKPFRLAAVVEQVAQTLNRGVIPLSVATGAVRRER